MAKSADHVPVVEFPSDVQDDLGYALYLAQIGKLAEKAKPMHGILRDVVEIVAIEGDRHSDRMP